MGISQTTVDYSFNALPYFNPHVSLLSIFQAEVYKEDFLKERKDRVKLKEKYLEQEKKFQKVHSELHVLKSKVQLTIRSLCDCILPCSIQ